MNLKSFSDAMLQVRCYSSQGFKKEEELRARKTLFKTVKCSLIRDKLRLLIYEFFQVEDSGESARLGLQKEESVEEIVRL